MPSALILEDGTGISGADTYSVSADIDTYAGLSPIGASWLSLTQALKDDCARQAARYEDAVYASPARLTGRRQLPTQGLAWPRAYAFDRDSVPIDQNFIPPQWIVAQIELALRSALYGQLQPDLKRQAWTRREQVGSLSVDYSPGTPQQTTFPYIDFILAPILMPGTMLMRG